MQEQQQQPAPAAPANSETFSYSANAAPPPGDAGVFDGWFLYMFAGALEIQLQSPLLTGVYLRSA
jgi:hypothetical protein